jgi:putative transposase
MKSDGKNRESYRLKGYDYSQEGSYFVTLCTKDRKPLFGEINNGVMQLTRAGETAVACWKEIPQHFTNVELDEFIVMPDYIHGIILIIKTFRRDVQLNIPTDLPADDYFSQISPKRGSLAVVMRTYKAAVTTVCRQNGIRGFVWQRGYHDHIIRDAKSLSLIHRYIIANPRH